LSVFAPVFVEELLGHGYRRGSAAKQLQLMAHVSRWMEAHSLEPRDSRMIEIDRSCRSAGRWGGSSLRPLARWFRCCATCADLGSCRPWGRVRRRRRRARCLAAYREYLLVRRGLAVETVRGCCNTARAFLADRERLAGALALEALDVAAINEYLLRVSQRRSVCSAKAAVTGLRSLLGFLHLDGLIEHDLAVAVAVAVPSWPSGGWRRSSRRLTQIR
jgi:hypothetical protein